MRLACAHLCPLARGDKRPAVRALERRREPSVAVDAARGTAAQRGVPGLLARAAQDEGASPSVPGACASDGICGAVRQTNVQSALDQANLLSGVRNDIECVMRVVQGCNHRY